MSADSRHSASRSPTSRVRKTALVAVAALCVLAPLSAFAAVYEATPLLLAPVAAARMDPAELAMFAIAVIDDDAPVAADEGEDDAPPAMHDAPRLAAVPTPTATTLPAPVPAAAPAPEGAPSVLVESCGTNTCRVGQVCCNESCGICAQPGDTCDQGTCDGPSPPAREDCGEDTCDVGTVCCDPSCGLCAPAGACVNRKC